MRPELVVEIAFNDVQASPQYPGGLALRFARVKRYRNDKRADEADTIETVRALHAAPARPRLLARRARAPVTGWPERLRMKAAVHAGRGIRPEPLDPWRKSGHLRYI